MDTEMRFLGSIDLKPVIFSYIKDIRNEEIAKYRSKWKKTWQEWRTEEQQLIN